MDHNSRTKFFQDMRFMQKVRKPLALSYSSRKRIYEWIKFLSKTQKPYFWVMFWTFGALQTGRDFFFRTFSLFSLNENLTINKNKKTWSANSEILRYERTNRWTERLLCDFSIALMNTITKSYYLTESREDFHNFYNFSFRRVIFFKRYYQLTRKRV